MGLRETKTIKNYLKINILQNEFQITSFHVLERHSYIKVIFRGYFERVAREIRWILL